MSGRKGRDSRGNEPGVVGIGLAFSIGPMMMGCLVVGCGLGFAFDRWAGTRPAGLMVGMIVGLVAAVVQVVDVIRKLTRATEAAEKERTRRDPEPPEGGPPA